MPTYYQNAIRERLATMGRIGAADPRHVEAWMRVEHSTLDALSPRQFDTEITIALDCIAAGPVSDSEQLAASMGL